jgi:hypothetical protein
MGSLLTSGVLHRTYPKRLATLPDYYYSWEWRAAEEGKQQS